MVKIINKTGWNTEDLRKLIIETFHRRGVDHRGYKMTIRQRSRCWSQPSWLAKRYSGLGSYPESLPIFLKKITIMVPAPKFYSIVSNEVKKIIFPKQVWEDYNVEFRPDLFCKILTHEIDHTLGLHHRHMLSWKELGVRWTLDFKVRPKLTTPRLADKKFSLKRKVLELAEKHRLRIDEDDGEIVIYNSRRFEPELSTLICHGWRDAYNRLKDYYRTGEKK